MYLPSQFQYTWLKDDVVDQSHNDTSITIQKHVDSEIFQSFITSKIEQYEGSDHVPEHRNAQMINTPTVNPDVAKIPAPDSQGDGS